MFALKNKCRTDFSILTFMFVSLSVLFLTLTTAPQAEAKERSHNSFVVGGTTLNLATPENNCSLNPQIPADNHMLNAVKNSIKGNTELVLQFADCQELKNWRTRKQKYLDTFGSYQSSLKLQNLDLTGKEAESIKSICDVYKKQGGTMLKNMEKDINKRVQDSFKNVKMNKIQLLGVVKENEEICAVATFQRLKTADGSTKDQINVYSITILKGKLIFSYLFAPNTVDVVDQLTDQIVALNKFNQQLNK